MELTDVRRLTGPNFLLEGPGAAAEAAVTGAKRESARASMEVVVKKLMASIGWESETIRFRIYDGGLTIAISAPIDALYAATSIIEIAWEMTHVEYSDADYEAAISRLEIEIAEEADENLLKLEAISAKRGIGFLWDDDEVSIGLGSGRALWTREDLPAADDINWTGVYDIPAVLVTGTNGKSTTVRLTAAIAAAAGKITASSSSDFVRVGDIILDKGDYSGPGGARMALRDPRADMAILETARGGLMRRGLPITGLNACLITNISADHLGEYGITDVPSLADAKFMVAKAVGPQGRLILNADDPELVSRARRFNGNISWFGMSIDSMFAAACRETGDHIAYLDGDMMTIMRGGAPEAVLSITDFPISLNGAAHYNVANGLGAMALASALGLEIEAMQQGLSGFVSTPENNPGRGNFMSVGGVNILVDFAHNPEGVRALADTVRAVPAERRLFLLGQAGDRSDDDIRDITEAVTEAEPDVYIVKELATALRGRPLGEVPAIILETLKVLGVPDERVKKADCEYDAVRLALEWAKPGDLLVLLVYVQRDVVMALLNDLIAKGWMCGEPLPAA